MAEIKCKHCELPVFQTQWGGWHHGPEDAAVVQVFCYAYVGDRNVAEPDMRETRKEAVKRIMEMASELEEYQDEVFGRTEVLSAETKKEVLTALRDLGVKDWEFP